MPDFMDYEAVAKQLYCSKKKVRELANQRQIAVTLVGNKRLFTQEAVDKFILGHTLQPIIDYNWLVKSYGQEAVDKFIREHTLPAKE
jgi:excisionase family DNA binding protein